LGAIEAIQQLLPEKEGYAIGKWSIADAAVTPFFARAEVLLKNDIGKYELGKGKAVWAKVKEDPKYARFRKIFGGCDSFKETFHPVRFFLSNLFEIVLNDFSFVNRT
jgi:glutathione S-transferase